MINPCPKDFPKSLACLRARAQQLRSGPRLRNYFQTAIRSLEANPNHTVFQKIS
jgi:hypothetical protein